MKRLFLFALGFSMGLSAVATDTARVRVDGQLNEWPDPLSFSNTSQGFSYGVRNDSQYIYFAFHSNTRSVIMRVLRGGMTVIIDTSGKRKERCLIDFPLAASSKPDFQAMKRDSFTRPNQNLMRQRMLKQLHEFRTSGFLDSNNRRQKFVLNAPDGRQTYLDFRLNITLTDEGLAYELAIPIKAIGLHLTHTKPMSLGIKIAGLEMQGTGRPMGEGPPPGGGMGGPPSGPPSGQSQNQDLSDMMLINESVEVWSKFNLWTNP